MLEGYKSNNHVVYSSQYHVVWCPKYRRGVFVGPMAKRCGQRIKQIAVRYRAQVHRLVEIDPQLGIHRLVKNVKGACSHALRQEFKTLRSPLPTLWTNRYFVSTVGGAPRAVIKPYVENQKNV